VFGDGRRGRVSLESAAYELPLRSGDGGVRPHEVRTNRLWPTPAGAHVHPLECLDWMLIIECSAHKTRLRGMRALTFLTTSRFCSVGDAELRRSGGRPAISGSLSVSLHHSERAAGDLVANSEDRPSRQSWGQNPSRASRWTIEGCHRHPREARLEVRMAAGWQSSPARFRLVTSRHRWRIRRSCNRAETLENLATSLSEVAWPSRCSAWPRSPGRRSWWRGTTPTCFGPSLGGGRGWPTCLGGLLCATPKCQWCSQARAGSPKSGPTASSAPRWQIPSSFLVRTADIPLSSVRPWARYGF